MGKDGTSSFRLSTQCPPSAKKLLFGLLFDASAATLLEVAPIPKPFIDEQQHFAADTAKKSSEIVCLRDRPRRAVKYDNEIRSDGFEEFTSFPNARPTKTRFLR
jgi:hypothetical protein